MVQDLMSKASDLFLEHFARLGVFSKVHALIGPTPEEEERAKVKEEKVIMIVQLSSFYFQKINTCFHSNRWHIAEV